MRSAEGVNAMARLAECGIGECAGIGTGIFPVLDPIVRPPHPGATADKANVLKSKSFRRHHPCG